MVKLNGYLFFTSRQIDSIRRGKLVAVSRGKQSFLVGLKGRHQEAARLRAKILALRVKLKQISEK